jgi:hypothetical protein
MADDKKGPPPPEKTHPVTPPTILFVIFIIVGTLFATFQVFIADYPFLAALLRALYLFFSGQASLNEIAAMTESGFIRAAAFLLQIISLFLTSLFLAGLLYAVFRLNEVMQILFAPLKAAGDKYAGVGGAGVGGATAGVGGPQLPGQGSVSAAGVPIPEDVNPKWLRVLSHINSDHASDWRLAILEADIMLDEMLDKMGYPGQTLGEKLKMVERSDFDTIDLAWEAHKMRNSIAHEGSDLTMSKVEAEKVITMFERVFREFKFI